MWYLHVKGKYYTFLFSITKPYASVWAESSYLNTNDTTWGTAVPNLNRNVLCGNQGSWMTPACSVPGAPVVSSEQRLVVKPWEKCRPAVPEMPQVCHTFDMFLIIHVHKNFTIPQLMPATHIRIHTGIHRVARHGLTSCDLEIRMNRD